MARSIANSCIDDASNKALRVDTLRGLAALAVAFYHVRSELWVGWAAIQQNPRFVSTWEWGLSWLGVPMRFAGAGVLLFFVISGYCIHRPQAMRRRRATAGKLAMEGQDVQPGLPVQLVTGKEGDASCVDWGPFYIRRFLRIYPPYALALAISVVVLITMPSRESGIGWERFWASLPMLQNYWPPGGQISSNPSLWSLPVEMELYLIYPIAWWVGMRLSWSTMLLLAVVVSVVSQWACSMHGVRWLEAGFPRFWALWCAGAWMAELQCENRLPSWNGWWAMALAGMTGLAAISEIVSVTRFLSSWLWAVVGILSLLWAISPRQSHEAVGTAGGILPLAWIGTFSYSLYLIHYPLFQWAGSWWAGQFGAKPSNLLVAIAAVGLALPSAWMFHRLVELPSHHLARKLGRVKPKGLTSHEEEARHS